MVVVSLKTTCLKGVQAAAEVLLASACGGNLSFELTHMANCSTDGNEVTAKISHDHLGTFKCLAF